MRIDKIVLFSPYRHERGHPLEDAVYHLVDKEPAIRFLSTVFLKPVYHLLSRKKIYVQSRWSWTYRWCSTPFGIKDQVTPFFL